LFNDESQHSLETYRVGRAPFQEGTEDPYSILNGPFPMFC
jgi:hypothetical protein